MIIDAQHDRYKGIVLEDLDILADTEAEFDE
jgi:hypothetical protein